MSQLMALVWLAPYSSECPNGEASRDESSYGGCPQRDFYPGDRHAPTKNEPKELDTREQEEKKSRDKRVSMHQSSGLRRSISWTSFSSPWVRAQYSSRDRLCLPDDEAVRHP